MTRVSFRGEGAIRFHPRYDAGMIARLRPVPFDLGPVHFVGIGGIGMSGIAEVLLNLGYNVSGSDLGASATTARLAGLGAKIAVGHDAGNGLMRLENDRLVIVRWATGEPVTIMLSKPGHKSLDTSALVFLAQHDSQRRGGGTGQRLVGDDQRGSAVRHQRAVRALERAGHKGVFVGRVAAEIETEITAHVGKGVVHAVGVVLGGDGGERVGHVVRAARADVGRGQQRVDRVTPVAPPAELAEQHAMPGLGRYMPCQRVIERIRARTSAEVLLQSDHVTRDEELDEPLAPASNPPDAEHWFGTDALGRDIFSRTLVATRLDMGIAVSPHPRRSPGRR